MSSQQSQQHSNKWQFNNLSSLFCLHPSPPINFQGWNFCPSEINPDFNYKEKIWNFWSFCLKTDIWPSVKCIAKLINSKTNLWYQNCTLVQNFFATPILRFNYYYATLLTLSEMSKIMKISLWMMISWLQLCRAWIKCSKVNQKLVTFHFERLFWQFRNALKGASKGLSKRLFW